MSKNKCISPIGFFSGGDFVSKRFVPGDKVDIHFEADSCVEVLILSYGEKPTEKEVCNG